MKDYLIVGLGNPGEKYQNTRHNIGFRILDSLLKNLNLLSVTPFSFNKKVNGELAIISDEEKIYLLKPASFMNLSGGPVASTVKYFDIAPENIIVIQDDIDLPFGQIRLAKNSGAGGHNGIKSIVEHLHSKDFTRLKIGISTEIFRGKIPAEKFVLGKFNQEEEKELEKIIASSCECIESFLENGLERTMNEFN